MKIDNYSKICVVGLGYVGTPLLMNIGAEYIIYGYDIDEDRVNELKRGYDRTCEVSSADLLDKKARFTNDIRECRDCDIYVVTVPTPVTVDCEPDMQFLISACEKIGEQLTFGNLVIFESTVYPGLTREICIPILEEKSGLKCTAEFYVGYSPERINPGDKTRTLKKITKVTSGCCELSRRVVDEFYAKCIGLTTYSAPSIEVAEAAKVIENTQRDINIALINELSTIFNECNIDTEEVLQAASTKWNFHVYKPGLVGGHCIGVDPYYLAFKARQLGLEPSVILAGRKINEGVVSRIAKRIGDYFEGKPESETKSVLILGATFKENCPDVRNSKSIELYNQLAQSGCLVHICDPLADFSHGLDDILTVDLTALRKYDVIVMAVGHQKFVDFGVLNFREHLKEGGKFMDLKSVFEKYQSDFRL